jgi:surface adhesion protein
VTLANGQTITIEVGKTTGTVTTTAPNDALNGHAPLTNSITDVSGGNYENLVADKTRFRPPSPTPSTPPTCR